MKMLLIGHKKFAQLPLRETVQNIVLHADLHNSTNVISFEVFHPEVLQYTKNTIRQSITQYLFCIHRYTSIYQGDMFRPSWSSSGPPRK